MENLNLAETLFRLGSFSTSFRPAIADQQNQAKGEIEMNAKSKLIIIAVLMPLSQICRAQCPQICDSNDNTALGNNALPVNTRGINNTAVGFEALQNILGNNNTATGFQALKASRLGVGNTAYGGRALTSVRQGSSNTAVGYTALANATQTFDSTAVGFAALGACTTCSGNTAVGYSTLGETTIGAENTAIGELALPHNETGFNNIAIGVQALINLTAGSGNIAIGNAAGENLTGSDNIDIAAAGVGGELNTIRIGTAETHQATYIAGISGVTVAGGVGVVVDSSGHLGTTTSSARYKEAIKPMDKASEAILSLQPVSFRYKHELDPDSIPQFGLVAEQVAKVNPDLVVRDGQGKPYTVRYEAVNAMLLNEFLKEHRKVTEQQGTIGELRVAVAQQQSTNTEQEKAIKSLTAALKEQAAQIQKVSAELEARKSSPQIVLNNQ